MKTLGIETSCDETAVSICKDGQILSNVIGSQLIHTQFGGVVPEIASREHERLLNSLTIEAIEKAKLRIKEIEGIAVTNGPGLAGALLTGVSFAKGLALGLGIKIISINHLELWRSNSVIGLSTPHLFLIILQHSFLITLLELHLILFQNKL